MPREFKKLIGLLMYNNITFKMDTGFLTKNYFIFDGITKDYKTRLWEIDIDEENPIGFTFYVKHKIIKVKNAEEVIMYLLLCGYGEMVNAVVSKTTD